MLSHLCKMVLNHPPDVETEMSKLNEWKLNYSDFTSHQFAFF